MDNSNEVINNQTANTDADSRFMSLAVVLIASLTEVIYQIKKMDTAGSPEEKVKILAQMGSVLLVFYGAYYVITKANLGPGAGIIIDSTAYIAVFCQVHHLQNKKR